ncbi:CBO0543 family protein [Domibacillus robiginosus]|uniref:CBO0543 family protein n=1 Tax=Domibacillus robiginosus TaxID=1071054 RepID=UPI00067C76C2|nr:CBO0543 family protein [Domibacillus robiginosus]
MYFSMIIFIVPWIIGFVHLHPKDRKLIPLIAPFTSAIAFLINELWVYFDFGEIHPFHEQETLPGLPFNIGLYPIVGGYLILFIRKSTHPYLLIFLWALCITFLESILVMIEHVVYREGWNILWTFLAYLAVFVFIYWFYLYLRKLKVID